MDYEADTPVNFLQSPIESASATGKDEDNLSTLQKLYCNPQRAPVGCAPFHRICVERDENLVQNRDAKYIVPCHRIHLAGRNGSDNERVKITRMICQQKNATMSWNVLAPVTFEIA
jgi:hypothetical protein